MLNKPLVNADPFNFAGASANSQIIDFAKFRKMPDTPTSTTRKTLGGLRSGIVLTHHDAIAEKVTQRFPPSCRLEH
jgi:glycine/serine hydroxymethyltransferase